MIYRFLGIVFISCLVGSSRNRCKKPLALDQGSLSNQDLTLVPNKNGETYRLILSSGKIISFSTNRHTDQFEEQICS